MRVRAPLISLSLLATLLVAPVATGPVHADTTSDACGPRPLKPDGTLWSCTFVDDFSSGLDRSKWLPQTVFASGQGDAQACYLDDPDNVSVSAGALRLTVRREAAPVGCPNMPLGSWYSAGMVTTYHLFSQQYGRFEARIMNTATREPGLQEDFWLWPDDRYDGNLLGLVGSGGEIDVAEHYSAHPDQAVPYLHYGLLDNLGPKPGVNTAWDCYAARGVWNTYTLEWDADSITILVNGVPCLTNTSGDPAFRKRYIISLTQGLGVFDNAYDGRAPLPATMSVDYVKVWS